MLSKWDGQIPRVGQSQVLRKLCKRVGSQSCWNGQDPWIGKRQVLRKPCKRMAWIQHLINVTLCIYV